MARKRVTIKVRKVQCEDERIHKKHLWIIRYHYPTPTQPFLRWCKGVKIMPWAADR